MCGRGEKRWKKMTSLAFCCAPFADPWRFVSNPLRHLSHPSLPHSQSILDPMSQIVSHFHKQFSHMNVFLILPEFNVILHDFDISQPGQAQFKIAPFLRIHTFPNEIIQVHEGVLYGADVQVLQVDEEKEFFTHATEELDADIDDELHGSFWGRTDVDGAGGHSLSEIREILAGHFNFEVELV